MLRQHRAPVLADDGVLAIVIAVLRKKLNTVYAAAYKLDAMTKPFDIGVVDSQDFMDLILEVEDRCGGFFEPDRLDLEGGVTLGQIAGAFRIGSAYRN
jgi:acyl carrier protein